MTKRVGAKQECGTSALIEETLLDLLRWYDSHRRYKALVRRVAVRPSADLHDDRPASIDLLAIAPTHARYYPRQDSALSGRPGQLAVRKSGLTCALKAQEGVPEVQSRRSAIRRTAVRRRRTVRTFLCSRSGTLSQSSEGDLRAFSSALAIDRIPAQQHDVASEQRALQEARCQVIVSAGGTHLVRWLSRADVGNPARPRLRTRSRHCLREPGHHAWSRAETRRRATPAQDDRSPAWRVLLRAEHVAVCEAWAIG